MTRVKICCIGSIEEAQLAIRLGASAVGLVSEMPSGPGVIPEALIAKIVATIPHSVSTMLLTSETDAANIAAQQNRCGVNTIQICDSVPHGTHETLRELLPGVSLIQVVHVTGKESVIEAVDLERKVDALLLDSGSQSLPVKELGGTGRTHDWSVSAEIVSETHVPVFLAGGLNAGNIREAIETVQPYGVDVCTGVRTAGGLDEEKLVQFMSEISAITARS